MARLGKDPAGDNRDAAVVDSLIKKLRPLDYRSSVSDRGSIIGARPVSGLRPVGAPLRPGAVWACVTLGILLGIALPLWPYGRACGWWLLLYLIAVSTVVVAGVWGALISWRSRVGLAHIVALATMIWGLTLATSEVLPRVGYAKVRLAWRCHYGSAAAASANPLSALKRHLEAGLSGLVR